MNVHIKTFAHTVILKNCHRKTIPSNHTILACFKKLRDDEDKKDAYTRSKSSQNYSVKYFRSPFLISLTHTKQIPNLLMLLINIVVEVHQAVVLQIETFHHKTTDTAPILETDTDLKKLLLLHNLTDQPMTIIDEIHTLSFTIQYFF